MDLTRGDYVSCMWICESADAMWSITLLKRTQTGLWEMALTWDKMNAERQGICRTLVHRIFTDGGLLEDLSIARVEQIVGTIEAQRQCNRVAYVEVKAGDPDTIIARLYEAAQVNERLGYLIVIRDQSP